ncbi:aminotransferase class I/II-fold pyridoxal phosphate-dependent enzyme [Methylocystis heyeri]|uniref:Aminotransferase class I/II-fold pyridoxal phosphate-dependent enzyme n=1 Tax=Methylocystis heyeri TaxID=391905 RepID=A0A6B8KM51_9HYPH|nr:aminotransferase class I/II-fold pyridoxal phosphate-dependent enzyme [Methylocystis heyeri]QGM48215.1 aminotransferase class I/II-fold pyridoxal phosphate-dependent enzyme [Methylocystis heyeri]
MPTQGLTKALATRLDELAGAGRLKGKETVIRGFIPARGGDGPRYLIAGEGDWPFLRMNANNYLGMSLRLEVVAAEEEAAANYGAGPGAVRFIGGTWTPHIALEQRLAAFHRRPAAMLFSSAYAAIMGVIPPLVTDRTALISDELNHNCIINAIALARPAEKRIYKHVDMGELERCLEAAGKSCARAIIVTDGVFSMRGDHAPLDRIMGLARAYDGAFAENAIVVVDDSHGVGALGASGRGAEEYTQSPAVDVLVATLGKALGVNGGYVVADEIVIRYLRETSPLYVFSNPITPGEAAAAHRALDILDSPAGLALLAHLRAMTARFKAGLVKLGFETLPGEHPVVPLLTRDAARTLSLTAHLWRRGVLVTGLTFPVVPKEEDEIRFQISADHTPADIDAALEALAEVAPNH